MALVPTSIFSSNLTNLLPSTNPINKFPSHSIQHPINIHTQTRQIFQSPKVASIPFPQINIDYLQTEFSGHGVSFSTLGHSCVVRMALENGSVATLMLPSGLITSYKPSMWHGGLQELLHTSVSEAEDGGGATIHGGVSLAFRCEGDEEKGGFSWSPTAWTLRSVGGSAQESIQVELFSSHSEEKIQIKHIVTLREDTMSSEVVVSNMSSSSLRFMGSIIGHLAVSTPEATYAIGLERSNYSVKPPFLSKFSLIPPDFNKKDSRNSWDPMAFMKLLSGLGSTNQNNDEKRTESEEENDEEMEGEEEDDYKHLTQKLSMIYTNAPRNFTIIDRGKRNSVVVGREGFDEVYVFSPGSSYASYGKYSYVCIGQAALLKPVTIGPEAEWRGTQHLHNPNL